MFDQVSREAWVWLTKYQEDYGDWVRSSMRDSELASRLAENLEHLLEESPALSRDTAALAMHACMVSRRHADPPTIAPFVRVARQAMIHNPRTVDQLAVVLICYALALLHDGNRIEGLKILREFQGISVRTSGTGPFNDWMRANGALLEGQLWELGLERIRAQRAYEEAASLLEPFVNDPDQHRRFVDNWRAGFAEASGDSDTFQELADMELQRLFVESSVGSATNLSEKIVADERSRVALRACRALIENGPQPGMSPFVIGKIIEWLEPQMADSQGAALSAALERWKEAESARAIPTGFTNPEVRARLQRSFAYNVARIEKEWPAWKVSILFGHAARARRNWNLAGARTILVKTIHHAKESRLALLQAVAVGEMLALDFAEGKVESQFAELFLTALAATVMAGPNLLDDPAVRAMLEEPISAVAYDQMAALAQQLEPIEQSRAAAIIDLIRDPQGPESQLLVSMIGAPGEQSSEFAEAYDLINRIEDALGARPSALALVVQSLPAGAAFLLVGPQGRRHFAAAEADYSAALDRLEKAGEAGLMALLADLQLSGSGEQSVRKAGQAAFDALPSEIRRALAGCQTLLLVADVRGPHPILPIELFHDGSEYVGKSKVIARFTSLRHLAEVLERPALEPDHARGLITAVPFGRQPLPAAAEERDMICSLLEQHGYDAPAIGPERLSPKFYRERLSHVDVLHIAAHGESDADKEWLVLPDDPKGAGQSLTVDDFLDIPRERMPFIYLSTCNLARTRYLGGGIGRGLAFTLSEMGAPAVISNSSPILDGESVALVISFYELALAECVGDALRLARHRSGTSPHTWGRAVLFGDPWHRLPKGTADGDAGEHESRILITEQTKS